MKNLIPIGYWIYSTYQYIFDHNINPLRHLSNITDRFLVLYTLAAMWCISFGVYAVDSLFWTGISLIAHALLIGMVFITAQVFDSAYKHRAPWLLLYRHKLYLAELHRTLANNQEFVSTWEINKKSDK